MILIFFDVLFQFIYFFMYVRSEGSLRILCPVRFLHVMCLLSKFLHVLSTSGMLHAKSSLRSVPFLKRILGIFLLCLVCSYSVTYIFSIYFFEDAMLMDIPAELKLNRGGNSRPLGNLVFASRSSAKKL